MKNVELISDELNIWQYLKELQGSFQHGKPW